MRQRCGDVTRVVHCTGVAPGGDGRRSTSRPMCACGPRPCVGADPPAGGIGEKNPCHAPTPIHCAARGALGGGRSDSDGRKEPNKSGAGRGGAERQAARLLVLSVPSVRCWSTRHHHHHSGPRNLCELEEISWAPAAVPTSIGLRAHRTSSVFSPLYGSTTIGVRTFIIIFLSCRR